MAGHGASDYGTAAGTSNKMHRPAILANHILHWISSIIVMSIAAYFISAFSHNTHIIYWVTVVSNELPCFLRDCLTLIAGCCRRIPLHPCAGASSLQQIQRIYVAACLDLLLPLAYSLHLRLPRLQLRLGLPGELSTLRQQVLAQEDVGGFCLYCFVSRLLVGILCTSC